MKTWHRWDDWAIAIGFALFLVLISGGWA